MSGSSRQPPHLPEGRALAAFILGNDMAIECGK
jgi:hypothetical protein